MSGLFMRENARMSENASPLANDAALIGGAQNAEQFCIACYETVRTLAELQGVEEIVGLLVQTLTEKIELNRALTDLATAVNPRADDR